MSIFTRKPESASVTGSNLQARGEPFVWIMAGGLVIGVLMIVFFLGLIVWNGLITFYPGPIHVLDLTDGRKAAGEPMRSEMFSPPKNQLEGLPPEIREKIRLQHGHAERTLYKTGNFDLYHTDYQWISEFEIRKRETPGGMVLVERVEWGPFIGTIQEMNLDGEIIRDPAHLHSRFSGAHRDARQRSRAIFRLERHEIGGIHHAMEQARLTAKQVELDQKASVETRENAMRLRDRTLEELDERYRRLQEQADSLKEANGRFTITLADVEGRTKTLRLSDIVRLVPANDLGWWQRGSVYLSRWWEFLTQEPREANTEGGVMPAIFGTFTMTLLMVLVVAPFGVMSALYLREYAKQGRLVSMVRICVNNLAGVPSIVYGVFGLGFFAYTVGGWVDQMFFPERLPSPTFGTGGILWSALTLALLTVPVVIVATEEALSAVPHSLREGSLACGASRWQTIRYVVLPKAMPGIMTGLILAMARGAGEVAPLMLVGVVKLAPELPIDGVFPFLHLERSFMHLAFHIFDVGFQSRNSEAGKPMVFVTTLLLISLIAVMNITAIAIRNRLKRRYMTGHF
jgi:phosphate transport system permease protein